MGDMVDLFSALDAESVQILFLDTETTGSDPQTAEVCEVAFLLAEYEGFSFTGRSSEFSTLVKPSIGIPPEASAVNQISNRMVADYPAAAAFSDKIAELAGSADYICAHNLPYDYTILNRQYPDVFGAFSTDSTGIDTLRLSRKLWEDIPSHSLQALRYRFELDSNITGDAHRALFDTRLVQSLLDFSLKQKPCADLNGDWKALVDFIASPLEVKIFTFGKYRGNLVEDTVAQDPAYIRWLLRQKWLPEEHPDLYHTMLQKMGEK